ncbi:agenet domain-containing protein [Deinococcus malanensis]|uniref:agenet domain-containing protein n=1 Tax=Deinococcus malanensis TaxID=1706855 RepID=UPI003630A158
MWDDADRAEEISDHLASQLNTRGITFKTLNEDEDDESYSLSFLLTDKTNRYVGVMYGDADSLVLGWCGLKTSTSVQPAPVARVPASSAARSAPRAPFEPGDPVLVQRGSAWVRATVVRIASVGVIVQYDNTAWPEEFVDSSLLRPAQPGPAVAGAPYRVGDVVEALWHGTLWSGATITEQLGDMYQVRWSSSGILNWVRYEHLREVARAATPAAAVPRPPAQPAPARPVPAPSPVPAVSSLKVGTLVDVQRGSISSEATVIRTRPDGVLVRYEDNTANDEWVDAGRVTLFQPGVTRGGPKSGTYQCYHPMYENSYMGSFVVTAGGNYRYLTGTKKSGVFSYNEATRALTWKSGEWAGKVARSEYRNVAGQGPMILLAFEPGGRRAGNYQRCLYRG